MLHVHVPDMSCDGCVRAMTSALRQIDPDVRVAPDLAAHDVRIDTQAAPEAILAALADAGFPATRR